VKVELPLTAHIFSRVFYPLAVLQYGNSMARKVKEKQEAGDSQLLLKHYPSIRLQRTSQVQNSQQAGYVQNASQVL
jgi:hypothetical protein